MTNECTYTQQLDTGLHAAAGSTVPGGQAGATVPCQKVRSACEIRDTERRDVGVAGCNYRIQTALLVRARRRSVYIYEYYLPPVAPLKMHACKALWMKYGKQNSRRHQDLGGN